jgi:uncharacterized protein (DUF488 family)
MAATVWTVGHSTRTAEDFLELLRGFGIEVLVDVRRYPGSRRHPQFGKEALATSLAAAGIRYVHREDLGGRRAARSDSPNLAWRVEAFRGYADYMATPEFQRALEDVLALGTERRTVVMCAEAVPWRCHRQLIADSLVARNATVHHILAPGKASAHALSKTARVLPGGLLRYDVTAGAGEGVLPFEA